MRINMVLCLIYAIFSHFLYLASLCNFHLPYLLNSYSRRKSFQVHIFRVCYSYEYLLYLYWNEFSCCSGNNGQWSYYTSLWRNKKEIIFSFFSHGRNRYHHFSLLIINKAYVWNLSWILENLAYNYHSSIFFSTIFPLLVKKKWNS